MGALISKEHLAKVQSYISLAKSEGGTVRCGGTVPEGLPADCKGALALRVADIADGVCFVKMAISSRRASLRGSAHSAAPTRRRSLDPL